MSGDDQFQRLVASLLDTYRPEGVVIWLGSANRNFGGRSPLSYIREDDWQPLFDEADRLAGGPRDSRPPHVPDRDTHTEREAK